MYENQRFVIRVLQSAMIVAGLLAMCGFVYLMFLALMDQAAGKGQGNGVVVMQVVACWIAATLACGFGWALLAAVLAVFDLAERAHAGNGFLDELVRQGRKNTKADPFDKRA